VNALRIERDLPAAQPRVLVVGDIHGCLAELLDLVELAGLGATDRVVALGDVVDRGPQSQGVLEFLRKTGGATSLMGNHERKHVRSFKGEVRAALSQQIVREEMGDSYADAVAFMGSFPAWMELPDALLVHGFWEPGVVLQEQKATVIIGTLTGEHHLAKHYPAPWYALYDGPKPLIVGHHDYLHTGAPLIHRDRVYGLDTGCCYGGRLTGLLLPEWRVVSVPSRANYWADTRTRHGRQPARRSPVVWSEGDEVALAELIRRAELAVTEACNALHAAHPEFAEMSEHEKPRLFAEVARNSPLAPVMFRIKSGRGDRAALRVFLGHPRKVADLLARLESYEGTELREGGFAIGPIIVREDRYGGVYVRRSLGKDGVFTAWNCQEADIPKAPWRDDMVALDFWGWVKETGYVVGAGATEADARADLIQQIRGKSDHDWKKDGKCAYMADWRP